MTMAQPVPNILADLPDASAAEVFQTIAAGGGVKIERIVSRGQATPPGEWYDQQWDEWVMVVQGRARLLREGDGEPCLLEPGDWLHLPARCRHRVEWTDPHVSTVWLAVHWGGEGEVS